MSTMIKKNFSTHFKRTEKEKRMYNLSKEMDSANTEISSLKEEIETLKKMLEDSGKRSSK